jgi:arginine decarboxylase
MLSAFSQASMIHVNDPEFDDHRFRENLNMHTSTSPQYGMIASLDIARKQMSMEGFALLSRSIDIASRLRTGIAATGVFKVLELEDILPVELVDDGISLDPLKLSIDVSASAFSARELQLKLFDDYGIQLEKVTHNTLSVLVTLGATESKLLRLLNAMRGLAELSDSHTLNNLPLREMASLPALSQLTVLPRDAFFGDTQDLPLAGHTHSLNADIIGAISAAQVVPYPPGIPVLVPGQVITTAIANFLMDLHHSDNGTEIHGLVQQGNVACLRVVKGTSKMPCR